MRRGPLLTIFLIVFIDLVGFGIVLPNQQLYGKLFGIDNGLALAMIGATYSIFQFLFSPVLGKWSDRIGRRPVLLISQCGTLVGFLVLFAAHYFTSPETVWVGIGLLFGSRIIDGISGGNISTASAYIADITTPENRAKGMGLIGAAFGLGFVCGPLIGGVVGGKFGLAFVPLVAAAFSLAALVMTYFWLEESLDPAYKNLDVRRFSFDGLTKALARPVIGPMIWMFFLNGFAFAGMEQTLSLLIKARIFPGETDQDLKNASFYSGVLFFFIGMIIVVVQGGLIRRLSKRFGEARLVIVGPVLIALGLLVIGFAVLDGYGQWVSFYVGCGLLAVGSSLFNPSIQALISRHAAANEQGVILGANQGMASLARAVGPILAGSLYQYVSHASPYYVSAVLCVGVTVWAWGMMGRQRG